MTRALVLSAGGPAGAAWMLGFIDVAVSGAVDLGAAERVIGTTPGALAGGALRGGALREVVALYRRGELRWFEYPATLEDFIAAAMHASDGATDRAEAVRRVANLEPLGSGLVSAKSMQRVVEAHLPFAGWPAARLELVAVDADTGGRVVFDADSDAGPQAAAAASCTSPGMSELIRIDGRRYADGGLHSPCNADVAAGSKRVLVLIPLPPPDLQDTLDDELATLGAAEVRVVEGDEASLEAMGTDRLSTKTMQAALEAGAEQCRRQLDELRSWWGEGSR
jgi:NTE family protein